MRLEKDIFKKQSFQEAADHQPAYQAMDATTRVKTFHYLMSVSYGFVGQACPRMDKQLFQKRRHNEVT
jgi:hypothetical protein